MRCYRRLLFIVVISLLLSLKMAMANENAVAVNTIEDKVIKVGYIEFPPVFSTDQQGNAVGSLISLTQKVLEHAGYKPKFQSLPTKRLSRHLVDGKVDLWVGLSTIPLFSGNTLIGQSEVMKITLQAYSLGKKESILSEQDLRHKSIIILRGYSYGGWINFIKDPKNKVHFLEVDSHKKALELLSHRRADFLLDYKGPISRALKTMKTEGLRSQEISSFPARFVISKAIKNAPLILQDIERAYRNLKEKELLPTNDK